VLEAGENLGYSEGNNFGLRYALENDAGYVLLLNNDTVVDPQMLSRLVEQPSLILHRDSRANPVLL
jgi:GT2 family glycosyltransferase